MSDKGRDPAPTQASKKPDAPVRHGKPPRAPSVVPEIPAANPDVATRRASTWRLGLLTTTLALLIGGLAWFSDAPELSRSEPAIAFGPSNSPSGPDDPLPPHVRHSIEQELRLAAIALEIRESHESLSRLWDDARSLASSIGNLKSELDTARTDAAAELARMDNRLDHIEVVATPELVPLGDPALREAMLLGYPDLPQEPLIIQASETVQPATTGGLAEPDKVPDVKAPAGATVKVTFAKTGSKLRTKAAKPLDGWLLHSVRDDLALVQAQDSHYEVRAGELLPDGGIVRAIKKRGERWVVLTTKGVIAEPSKASP